MQKIFNILSPVAFLVLGVLLYKGCDDKKKAEALAEVAEQKEQRLSVAYDSVADHDKATVIGWRMDTVHWVAEKTQLLGMLAGSNNAIDAEKAVIGGQVVRYDAAKAVHDTASQLSACDSIRHELTKAKVAVTDLQTSCETISTAFGNEINLRDSTIGVLASDFIKLRSIKDSLSATALGQAKENVRLSKQAAKHWSVGVGAGIVAGPGGIYPGLSLSAHYTLFRF